MDKQFEADLHLKCSRNTKETTAFDRKLSFLLFFSLFTILSSLFTNKLSFQRKDKREERKEMVSALRMIEIRHLKCTPITKIPNAKAFGIFTY